METFGLNAHPNLAKTITKSASKQTYYTILLFADHERVELAYRAYAYFRWVDDILDGKTITGVERTEFIDRQQKLLHGCERGEVPFEISSEESMLVDLIRGDATTHSGLQSYIHSMLDVMIFDAGRRGRLITQAELNEYTHNLATAVTEAMHYFIGQSCYSPRDESRYLAVSAAHITHMLRDTWDDIHAGYFNIPQEVLDGGHIRPEDVTSFAYKSWVRNRVQLARKYFKAGRNYLSKVENWRCRLAGYAYIARFDDVLKMIERDGYVLRPSYPERTVTETLLIATRVLLASSRHQRIDPRESAAIRPFPNTLEKP